MAGSQVPGHVNETIETIASLRAMSELRIGHHQRVMEGITTRLGRPATVYVLVGAMGLWVAFNLALSALVGHPLDPPPFFWLQGFMATYAALITTIVLTTQNRQNREAERRAELELQINLLAEQKAAKIISLLEELRRDMPTVRNRFDPVAEEMKKAVDPHAVMSALEQTEESQDPSEDP